jgi:hypothetical protein
VKRLLIVRGSHGLIFIALVVGFVGLLDAADNVVVPGVRCGPYILGKTTEREVKAMREVKGLDFQYSRSGVLERVILTTRDYQTNRQIRVGATEDEVVRAHGRGTAGNIDLTKGTTVDGSPVVVGKVGDKVLFYQGIQFVFAKQRVWAIILAPKSQRDASPQERTGDASAMTNPRALGGRAPISSPPPIPSSATSFAVAGPRPGRILFRCR